MSLEMIQVPSNLASNLSALIALIKEKTGLEITPPETKNLYKMRFPDMENAKTVDLYNGFNEAGIIFIDANNHFLAQAVGDGISDIGGFSDMHRNFIFDYNGELGNMGAISFTQWSSTNTSLDSSYDIAENYPTKQDIILVPLRVYGSYYNEANTRGAVVKTFVKNCYVNYERRFQPGLKFVDQNGNEFITLGGYLLYYNGKHK